MTVTSGNPVLGGTSNIIGLEVANPSSNQFTITGFVVNVPSGWTITGSTAGTFLTSHPFSATAASWTVSVFTVGTGAGIPPGGSDSFSVTVTAATGTYPLTSTFTSKVQDASAVAFYTGPSFTLQVIDPTTNISVTPASTVYYAAGTAPLTETATISPAQAGVPVVFSAPGYGSSTTFSFTPSTAMTNSSGMATTTFQPSDTEGDATHVGATIGTCTAAGCSTTSSGTVITVNGPPATVALVFATGFSYQGTNYLDSAGVSAHNGATTAVTEAWMTTNQLSGQLQDKFGNAVDFSSFTGAHDTWTVTLTATGSSAFFDATSSAVTHPQSISCASGGSWTDASGNALTPGGLCPSGATNVISLPANFFQSATYGTTSVITAAVSGTYLGNAFISTLSHSGNIFTSVLKETTAPTAAASPTSVKAGGSTTVSTSLGGFNFAGTMYQQNVPIQLYLDTTNSYETTSGAMDYGANSLLTAGFSNGMTTISGATNSTGQFSSSFTVDTVEGSHAYFYGNLTFPVDTFMASSGSITVLTSNTDPVITTAGPPAKFTLRVTYDAAGTNPVTNGGKAVFSAPLYVDVYISDAYNNLATNPGPGQIQITLSATGGVLTASNIYIPAGCKDTSGYYSALGPSCSPFGVVVWTLPSSAASLTLTATGVLSGLTKTATFTLSTVSPNPSITVTSPTPVSGVLYSNSDGIIFGGVANASAGYPSTGTGAVTISSVTYSIDNAANASATLTSSGHDVTWQASVFLTSEGMHNVTFFVTDSVGNEASSGSFKILVDTSAPTVAFTTKTGANLTYGSTVSATIVDTEGDLNASSVSAAYNGTAIASSNILVSGTNNLGVNTTYTVVIKNLPSGTWTLTLSATDYAGNTGSATSITVTVSVPFAESIIINSASYGTLGSFNGVSISATNIWSTSQSLVIFAVWKNSAGETVAVTTGGLTLAAGATGTTFAPLAGALPSGTYTVSVFAITTNNNPVSSTFGPISVAT